MSGMARLFGSFISIEESGAMMAPLFSGSQERLLPLSGSLVTQRGGALVTLPDSPAVANAELRERMWQISLELCGDHSIREIAAALC